MHAVDRGSLAPFPTQLSPPLCSLFWGHLIQASIFFCGSDDHTNNSKHDDGFSIPSGTRTGRNEVEEEQEKKEVKKRTSKKRTIINITR